MVAPPILMMDRLCDDRSTPQVTAKSSAGPLRIGHRSRRIARGKAMNHLGVAEELERTVALRGGARVRLRPIRSDDAPRLVSLYDRLSADTAYRRFFSRMRTLPPELAHHMANVDHQRRLAVVAEPCEDHIPVVIGV